MGRELVRQAVGKGIRERDPEFEDVGPGRHNGAAGRKGCVKIGVARAEVGDESRAVLRCARPKASLIRDIGIPIKGNSPRHATENSTMTGRWSERNQRTTSLRTPLHPGGTNTKSRARLGSGEGKVGPISG